MINDCGCQFRFADRLGIDRSIPPVAFLVRRLAHPLAVQDEVVTFGGDRPAGREVASAKWIRVVQVHDTIPVELLRERLGAGESEAIVLAIESNADFLLMDELRGQRVAEARGINKTGTLGTLVLAKKRGLVPAITPLLDLLTVAGFRMSEQLRQTVLGLAGEP